MIFDENSLSKQNSSDGTPQDAAFHRGLFCLPIMSHKRDPRPRLK